MPRPAPVEWWYGQLCRLPLTFPGGHLVVDAIRSAVASGAPVEEQIADIEAALKHHGLLDGVERRLASRWAFVGQREAVGHGA